MMTSNYARIVRPSNGAQFLLDVLRTHPDAAQLAITMQPQLATHTSIEQVEAELTHAEHFFSQNSALFSHYTHNQKRTSTPQATQPTNISTNGMHHRGKHLAAAHELAAPQAGK